jgi:hypothetical protein
MSTNFPSSLDSYSTKSSGDTISEDHINNVQDAIEALEAKVGINSSSVDTSVDYKVNNFFVENVRKAWLYENTAPTGWTYQSLTDRVLAVKGGSGLYNANGGTTAGETWANLKAHTHSTPNHTHPAHKHQWFNAPGSGADESYNSAGTKVGISTRAAQASVNHFAIENSVSPNYPRLDTDYYTQETSTASGGAGTSGAQSTSDVRPAACIGIIVTYTGA